MTKVEEAIVEIDNSLSLMADPHEGLRDLSLLDLTQESRNEVLLVLANFDRRFAHLTHSKQALMDLMADGHPTLPPKEVPEVVLTEIEDNARTVSAAVSQFTSDEAIDMRFTVGRTETK